MAKTYFRDGSDYKPLVVGLGSCFATDHITVDGLPVGYMYRETPDHAHDSGWRFFSGTESNADCNKPANLGVYDVNTIANLDPMITPYLDAPLDSAFTRDGNEFRAEKRS